MRQLFIPKNLLVKILLIPLLFTFTGCIYLVVGGIGAVGGYIVSPDTVEGISEYDHTDIWDAAIEIVSIMGIIKEQQEDVGQILAKVNGAKVIITITPLSESTVKLSVKSRKMLMPKIGVAQDIFVKVMKYLDEGGA